MNDQDLFNLIQASTDNPKEGCQVSPEFLAAIYLHEKSGSPMKIIMGAIKRKKICARFNVNGTLVIHNWMHIDRIYLDKICCQVKVVLRTKIRRKTKDVEKIIHQLFDWTEVSVLCRGEITIKLLKIIKGSERKYRVQFGQVLKNSIRFFIQPENRGPRYECEVILPSGISQQTFESVVRLAIGRFNEKRSQYKLPAGKILKQAEALLYQAVGDGLFCTEDLLTKPGMDTEKSTEGWKDPWAKNDIHPASLTAENILLGVFKHLPKSMDCSVQKDDFFVALLNLGLDIYTPLEFGRIISRLSRKGYITIHPQEESAGYKLTKKGQRTLSDLVG